MRAKYTHRTNQGFILCVFRDCIELSAGNGNNFATRHRGSAHGKGVIVVMRNSFIQMSKLTNVKGRISYIASYARQENLYAVYETTDRKFWHELAECNQEEFKKSGTEGKCIEARELILSFPESFTKYDPELLLELFTEHFKQKYDVECIAALHHNKRKTNYHIHFIFSERRLLAIPEDKIATRNRYYDEQGKFVRTKKEVTDGNGKLREGCSVILKGEVYKRNIFTIKDSRFKTEAFLNEAKCYFTELMNLYVIDITDKLKVYDKNGPYLATKKIGKNNPKAKIIEADNKARMKWNQTVDRAFVCGIPEEQILKVKKSEISDQVKRSVKNKGDNPSLFQRIIELAVKALELIITKVRYTFYGADDIEKTVDETIEAMREYPEEPEWKEEYVRLRTINSKLSEHVRKLYDNEQKLVDLERELKNMAGLFKSKEKKQLKEHIEDIEQLIINQKEELSEIVQKHGFGTVKEFIERYNELVDVKEMYERRLQNWEQENVPAKWPVELVEMHRRQREHEKEMQINKAKKIRRSGREER